MKIRRKRKKYFYFHYYDDNNENKSILNIKASNDFRLGDIVKIHNYGRVYTTYKNAFKYFNILKYSVYNDLHECFELKLNNTYNDNALKSNWVIIGMAVHTNKLDVICCIKNSNNQYLVINESGLHNVPSYKNTCNKGFIEKNKKILTVIN